MGSQQQFCLRWNNHQTNLLSVFEQLLQSESFVDVTLACEGLSLRAHKVVLSACSPYFQTLFVENPCKHPIVILKDIPYTELKALIEFMYKGEVNVSQDRLSTLLKTAEYLKIKGLSEVSQNHSEGDSETTMTKSKQRLQLHMDGQRASSATPPPQSTHSPPSKRKKLHQRRQSDSVSGTSDLEECEVPHLKGSPEVLESRVELPQNVEDRQICPPIHPQEEVLTLSNSPQDAKEHIMTASPQQEDTSQPSDPGGSGLFQSTGSSTNLLPPLQSAPSTSQPSQVMSGNSMCVWNPLGHPSYAVYENSSFSYQEASLNKELEELLNVEQIAHLNRSPSFSKMTCSMMTALFTDEEMSNCVVTGTRTSASGIQKPRLDQSKVKLIIGYVQSKFPQITAAEIRAKMAQKCKDIRIRMTRQRRSDYLTIVPDAVASYIETQQIAELPLLNGQWSKHSQAVSQGHLSSQMIKSEAGNH